MDRLKLVVNPTSGQEAAVERLAAMNARLREAFDAVDITLTTGDDDAEAAAARAVEEGYTHVVAAGGDGTLNQVLNGVAGAPGGLDSVTLGIIPLGTGNDFARALGLPADPDGVIERFLARRAAVVDLGRANGRLFANTAAGGFIAETSERVGSGLKTLAGRIAYLIGGAQMLLEYEPVAMRARSNGIELLDAAIHTFVICNAPFIGGGHRVAPHARIDDGMLDACFIRATSAIRFVALLRQLSQGEHVDADEVEIVRAPAFELDFDRPITVNTDGEEPIHVTHCSYRVLPGAARFLS